MHDEDFWERLPREPREAYAAFQIYRDLGPARTLADTYRRLLQLKPGATSRLKNRLRVCLRRWQDDWVWAERAHAYDRAGARRHALEQAALQQARDRRRLIQQVGLEQHIYKLLNAIAEVLNRCLDGPLDKTSYRSTAGAQVTNRVIDKPRHLQVLSEVESALAEVITGFDGASTPYERLGRWAR